MESKLKWWRILDELSVIDAAILITGNNPSEKEYVYDDEENRPVFDSNG